MTTPPRIYVSCLAAYNNGQLHGEWIDATDADVMQEEIARILASSPQPNAEEWAIHDHEGFCGVDIGENPDLDKLAALASNLEEHGAPFALYVENSGQPWDDVEGFEEAYQGEYQDAEDFAYRIVDETDALGGCSQTVAQYFDYQAYGRDLLMSDFWGERKDGSFYVFRNL